MRQGNLSPQCFTPSRYPLPPLPALHKQTNYGNGYKLDPFSENAPSTFFFPALPCLVPISLLTRCAVCLHTYSYMHVHTNVLEYTL